MQARPITTEVLHFSMQVRPTRSRRACHFHRGGNTGPEWNKTGGAKPEALVGLQDILTSKNLEWPPAVVCGLACLTLKGRLEFLPALEFVY
jgi:hypothetical protein